MRKTVLFPKGAYTLRRFSRRSDPGDREQSNNRPLPRDKRQDEGAFVGECCFDRFGFNPDNKMLPLRLERIKQGMILIPTVTSTALTRITDLTYQRAFTAISSGKMGLGGNALVDTKTHMKPGLFKIFPVVGPSHGQHGVDQRSINGGEASQLTVALR